MSVLEISLLGPFRVTLGGAPVTQFGADTARALLAYLALHAGVAYRRETLAGLLWPDQPESEARHNLSQALNRLRRAIADKEATPPFLDIARQTLAFSSESNYWLDVAILTEAVADSKDHRHRRLKTCSTCAQRLREAVDLYRGNLLEGFSLPSALFEEWLVVEREALHRQALGALSNLAAYHEHRGEYEQAVGYARRQLELEPWQEPAHRQVMRALALGGQRGAALAQYDACRRILAQELGVEPEAETTALYERIRDGEMQEAGSKEARPHNLPAGLTPFVGRERMLAEIRECLLDPDCRLLTLVGPGGSGKTRLALEAASRFVDAGRDVNGECFADGIYLIPLAPLRFADAVVPTVARALNYPLSGMGSPEKQLLDYLRRKEMLIVLDNAEHLLRGQRPDGGHHNGEDVEDFVLGVLKEAPEIKILATSRIALNVQSEQRYLVGGMDLPPPALEGERSISEYSAVKLFVHGAQRVRPDFEPGVDDLAHVARICRLVQGMPLGILLTAAWIRVLSLVEIARELSPSRASGQAPEFGQSLDFLETDLHDVPERQRSMRAVFDHSWNLLSGREAAVLAALSVFCGGCTRQAAQRVTGASLRELTALVDRSLLHHVSGGRFEMHELLRQYAAEKLALSPDEEERMRDRHCAFYIAALHRWGEEIEGPQEERVLAEMDADSENARAAWDWAAEQGQVERLDRALKGLDDLYRTRSRYQEGEAALQTAADTLAAQEALAPAQSADRLRVWARVLACQGACTGQRGHDEPARELLRRSLKLLEHPLLSDRDTRRERAFALLWKGRVSRNREQGREPLERSLALYRAVGDLPGVSETLFFLADAARGIGSLRAAERLHRECLAVARALGAPTWIADSLVFLGVTLMEQGQYEEAERLLREAVAVSQETHKRSTFEMAIRNLALVLLHCGKYAESHPLLEESVAICEDLGDRVFLVHADATFAHASLHLGRYARARGRGQLGLALGGEMENPWGTGFALLALGRVALAEEAHAEAQRWLQESADVLWESGNQGYGGWALVSLAHAAHALGQPARARQCLCKALRPALESGHHITLLSALPVLALLLADVGEVERAVELYALATRYDHVAHSRWYEDVVGKHITARSAALSSDAVAAARERGRARDLETTVKKFLADLPG
jgi:DNA-binding SARP family transcriptional activator